MFLLQMGEFWYETLCITTVWIKFFTLNNWVENSEEWRSIRATAGNPLPTSNIVGRAGIQEAIPEIFFPGTPVNHQMFYQKTSCNHTNAIVHISRSAKFPHPGINQWIACIAFFP